LLLNLEYLFKQFLEKTRFHHEEWERTETVHNLQFESLYDSLEAMTRTVVMIHTQVTNIDESHQKVPGISGKILGLFDDDDSSEEKNQEWTKEEES
ncbi:hypothetical protein PanWU01x14_102390, partial [Parasponia andersonii]